MIGVTAFVEKVRDIARRNPTYRTGGTGKDGTCDCIGLVMGAMYALEKKPYDIHSTNYFARFQTIELKKANEKELFVGQLLYRAREDASRLNARYKAGGRYYTGDLLDYYHVGIVTRLKPLEIIECTEYGEVSGIVINKRFKNWQYGGKVRGILYDGYEEEAQSMHKARVVTQSGALNIREWPDGPVIGKAPKGAEVEILYDNGDGWPEIRYKDIEGYMSDTYLKAVEDDALEETTDVNAKTTLLREDGVSIVLSGRWRVADD